MRPAIDTLAAFNVPCEVFVASAHRTPERVKEIAVNAREAGFGVIIAAAGAAAHLAGVVASFTTLPVIGVPINATSIGGLDSLLATCQMPSGVPVATMAIDGAKNAALFAIEILSLKEEALTEQLAAYREEMAAGVKKKAARLREML